MGKPLFTAAQFIAAIPGSGGIITTIAKRVKCSWHTAKKYIETYPTVAQAYGDEVESIADVAETVLIKAMQSGDLSAVKFYLSTKAKHRGYTPEVSVVGAVELSIRYEEYNADDDKDTAPDAV